MQDLWLTRLDWDDHLPDSTIDQWNDFTHSLAKITEISMPRWFQTYSSSATQLYVFGDASRRAIAAAVYIRVIKNNGHACVTLISAKTKLSPIRSLKSPAKPENRMTIPRLELRAALIAARMIRSVAEELDIPIDRCFAWSDAKIVLSWIYSSEPVGNSLIEGSITQIQELLPPKAWRYVSTNDNPADIASRGTIPSLLAQKRSWWHGPEWLESTPSSWPITTLPAPEPLNDTKLVCSVQINQPYFIERFSQLSSLLRFMVRLRRWLRIKLARETTSPVLDPVSVSELNDAFLACAKVSQVNSFKEELKLLRKGKRLPARNHLKSLDVFLDCQGLIRVGGRLYNSELPFDERHPVLLQADSSFSRLVINWAHQRALHGGFRITYAYVMRRSWLIKGKTRVKAHIRNCIVCARAQARPMNQAMAPLPSVRVIPARAFLHTGVDYAGPFKILSAKGRGIRTTKGYIAVFVCLSTKALHLELVGDLTTESFLGALSRFYGHRGRPKEIWSDNASNFYKADFELRSMLFKAEINWGLVAGKLADQGINWHFIPPAAPHFGGLWEAGVKSVKSHLKRVAGPRNLTFEEFSTLLVEIEMVLNCRPLTPLTGELDDLEVLTPGHFLVEGGLSSIPEASTNNKKIDTLTHWKLVRELRNRFWDRWSREYINTLQQRCKWTERRSNLQTGDLVLVLDPSLLLPNGRWPLGRILNIHPGQDGLNRV